MRTLPLLFGDEDFPLADMVGGGDEAFFLHLLHQIRGLVLADADLRGI
jgi:hypothetical protein